MPADRLLPDRVGEIYYLKHSPKHRWFVSPTLYQRISFTNPEIPHRYWLSSQKKSEPFAFVMYDTKAGNHARCKYLPSHSHPSPYFHLSSVVY